jgi:hypothetical protein
MGALGDIYESYFGNEEVTRLSMARARLLLLFCARARETSAARLRLRACLCARVCVRALTRALLRCFGCHSRLLRTGAGAQLRAVRGRCRRHAQLRRPDGRLRRTPQSAHWTQRQ